MAFRVLLIQAPASRNENGAGDLGGHDADRILVPSGLLSIASHLRAHGFGAQAINLSTFTWPQTIAAIRNRPADLFGLSCFTFHRHAAAALAAEIKALFPTSHVTVGGPHVSALPLEWLGHYPAFDTVVIGEGEATALDLAVCLSEGRTAAGIPGTAFRADGSPALGPPRDTIADLDSLGKPWQHFDYFSPITSRGCPGNCTYCCTPKLWGRKIRFRSADSVLEEIEHLVARRGHRLLKIKDDTFTAHRTRALAICQGILDRGLELRWTCDTRVDFVTPELLAAMRRAGCIKVSYGIESGSPKILRSIRKRTDLPQVLAATAAARDLGMDVRFYLMVGNRGETPGTVRQTLDLVERARPTAFYFCALTVYPGTEEFEIARDKRLLSVERFFTDMARSEFSFNMGESSPGMSHLLNQLVGKLGGGDRPYAPYTTVEREQILARHPDMLRSYTDLALDYCGEGRLDDAEGTLHRAAAAAGRETQGFLHHLACVHFAKKDMAAAGRFFERALAAAPEDRYLRRDVAALNAAGTMNAQQQAHMAAWLFSNLRSTDPLVSGQPIVPMPLDP